MASGWLEIKNNEEIIWELKHELEGENPSYYSFFLRSGTLIFYSGVASINCFGADSTLTRSSEDSSQ